MAATDDVASVIPFFYYDLVARMIPGGLTLAALLLVRDQLPRALVKIFQGDQTWKAVTIPLALGGLAYMIGTVFEAINDSYFFKKWLREPWDDKAFHNAFVSFIFQPGKPAKVREQLPFTKYEGRTLRTQIWEKLVFEAAKNSETNTMFVHCHRFQAEYKMFLHLMYPTLLLAGVLVWDHSYWLAWIGAIFSVFIFRYLAYRRDERRWWQVLVFGRELKWKEILDLAPTPSSVPQTEQSQ